MSDTLKELCIDSRIPHGLNSTLFDHKQISLIFKRHNPYKKQTINDVILKDPDLVEIVSITNIECYVNHLAPSETISDIEIKNYRLIIGRVCSMYKEVIECRLSDAENGLDQMVLDRIVELRNAIKNNLELLPGIEALQTFNLTCDRNVFLEILIMSVKASTLSHQHDFFKIKNAKKKYLETKIKDLKKNFQNNVAEILRTERDLNKVADDEMREEVLRMRNFEQLNNEKITPYFLSLAKKPQHSENLLDVCNANGDPFDNALDRDTYIRNYFADTYKKVAVPEHCQTIDQSWEKSPSILRC
jgi:hypothetical protein